MLTQASRKYRPAPPIPMAVRHWPGRTLTAAPRWCSVDLRDGNQALPTPMNPQRKERLLQMLLALGSQERAAEVAGLDRTDFLLSLASEKVNVFAVDLVSLRQELDIG